MTFFKTRYKVRQDVDTWEFVIYRREWWKPWWTKTEESYRHLKTALLAARILSDG